MGISGTELQSSFQTFIISSNEKIEYVGRKICLDKRDH